MHRNRRFAASAIAQIYKCRWQTEQQKKIDSLLLAREQELRQLEAELDSYRQELSQQADELHSLGEHIERLKLMVDKLRRVIFGRKSEKIVIQLEQLELELEDDEATHAELEAAAERISPMLEPRARPERKPLPEHLRREVVTHAPGRDCCPDCGGQLRQFGEDISEHAPSSVGGLRAGTRSESPPPGPGGRR